MEEVVPVIHEKFRHKRRRKIRHPLFLRKIHHGFYRWAETAAVKLSLFPPSFIER
jgi:hypothetical protein